MLLPLRYPAAWMLPGLALLALVTATSLVPTAGMTSPFSLADKLYHAASYFVLAAWLAGGVTRPGLAPTGCALAIYGAMLELAHIPLAYRSFDLLDLAANLLGVALGVLVSFLLLAGWCRRVERWLTP